MTQTAETTVPFVLPSGWTWVPGTTRFVAPGGGASASLVVETRAAEPPYPEDVEDADDYEIGGARASYTRFGQRVDGIPVVGERWVWQVREGYVVLTGSVAWEGYAEHCETFEAVAATFRPSSPSRG